ncbi:MAG: methylenetetrahydrofolate reductase, partial [Campylobacterales bacterium]|nr:methylenetetrahydrofolate reductase [Campylobacterales bacterium]
MFESFLTKLQSNEKFITVEITPPHGASIDTIIEKIDQLKLANKVDGFSVTDNPLAKLKMSGVLSAIKVQQHFNKPIIATMSM